MASTTGLLLLLLLSSGGFSTVFCRDVLSGAEKAELRSEAKEAHNEAMEAIWESILESLEAQQPGNSTGNNNGNNTAPPDNSTLPHPDQRSTLQRRLQGGSTCTSKTWQDYTQWRSDTPPWGFRLEQGTVAKRDVTNDWEGFRMRSYSTRPGTAGYSARMQWARNDFNTATFPETHIMVWMRGAPDAGKNSNLYLMEPYPGNTGEGIQDKTKDEVDLVEIWGTKGTAEYTLWRKGKVVSGGWGEYRTPINPGRQDYLYELFLVRGKYLKMWVMSPGPPGSRTTYSSSREFFGSDVPDTPLRLYTGIWDCAGFDQGACPAGKIFTGDASMVIKGLWIHNC